jgi:hypothetical protein
MISPTLRVPESPGSSRWIAPTVYFTGAGPPSRLRPAISPQPNSLRNVLCPGA